MPFPSPPAVRSQLSVGRLRYLVRKSFVAMRGSASSMLIDSRRGIDTAKTADLTPEIAAPELVHYEPSGWLDLRRVLRKSDVSPHDVFLDLGSGKGRVLLQAARYPFRRVIGVEIAPELTAVAHANVHALRGRQVCQEIELVTADALDYHLPADVTVLYMYNPFRGEVFARFVEKLIAALDDHPRPFRLIYSTPMEHECLMRTGRFSVVHEVRGLRPGRRWARKLGIRVYAAYET